MIKFLKNISSLFILIIISFVSLSSCVEEGLFIKEDQLPIKFHYTIYMGSKGEYIYNDIPSNETFSISGVREDKSIYFENIRINGNMEMGNGKTVYWPSRDAVLIFTALFPSFVYDNYEIKDNRLNNVEVGGYDLLIANDTLQNSPANQGIADISFYHSLAYLSQLSVERIKTDSSFTEQEEDYELYLNKVGISLFTMGDLKIENMEWENLENYKEFEKIPSSGQQQLLKLDELFSDFSSFDYNYEFFIPQELKFEVWVTLYQINKETNEKILIWGDEETSQGKPLTASIGGFNSGSRTHLCLQLSVKSILDRIKEQDNNENISRGNLFFNEFSIVNKEPV